MDGAIGMIIASVLALGSLGFLLFVMARSILKERKRGAKVWRNFGLSIALVMLFFSTWVAHGISQWQTYTDQQREHGAPVAVGDFFSDFMRSSMENWQSEFLQLFSFVVLAALLIHKGSAESKDSDEQMQAALKRIEEKLGTTPSKQSQSKKSA